MFIVLKLIRSKYIIGQTVNIKSNLKKHLLLLSIAEKSFNFNSDILQIM